MTNHVYAVARRAWVRECDDDPDTIEEQVVVLYCLGVFTARDAARAKTAEMTEEWLKELMFAEGVQTLDELAAKLGPKQVVAARQRYFVHEIELHDESPQPGQQEQGSDQCDDWPFGHHFDGDPVLRGRELPDYTIPAIATIGDSRPGVVFEALPWFERASDADIIALCSADWEGREAEEVACFMEGRPGYAPLDAFRDGCYTLDECWDGFVSEKHALAWLKEHRPELHAQLTAD